MTIQINTDHNIAENERMIDYFTTVITDSLKLYSENITRVEVHFSDENGKKEEANDKRCMLEVRLKGKQPIAVTAHSNSVEEALNSAIGKMCSSLKTKMGHLESRH